MIKNKCPQAYIVNFSSDPEAFATAVAIQGGPEAVFDAVVTNKSVSECLKLFSSSPQKTLHQTTSKASDISLIESDEKDTLAKNIMINTQLDTEVSCCSCFWPSRKKDPRKVSPANSIQRVTISSSYTIVY